MDNRSASVGDKDRRHGTPGQSWPQGTGLLHRAETTATVTVLTGARAAPGTGGVRGSDPSGLAPASLKTTLIS